MIKLFYVTTMMFLLFLSVIVEAHIRLISPIGRMASRDDAKFTQTNPANPGPDVPGPCSNYTTPMATRLQYTAGQSININLVETINHPGRFIIQFSPSGNTGFWQSQNQLANVVDTQSGGARTIPIKFPNTPCENCMMRVLQQMDDQPGEFYVHCYDIKLNAAPAAAAPPTESVTKLDAVSSAEQPKFGGGCGLISTTQTKPNDPNYFLMLFLFLLIPGLSYFYFRRFSWR